MSRCKKRSFKKHSIRFFCTVMIICMLLTTSTSTVYALDKYLGTKNLSDDIYRWTRIKSTQELVDITVNNPDTANKELRLLLIPAVSEGLSEAPSFDHYSILDDDEDCLTDISLKENPMISHKADVFYTRGAFRTPYLVYMGMADTKKDVESCGEIVPSYRLYEADKNDRKTSELLIGRDTAILRNAQYLWTEKDLKDLDENKMDDTWAFAFLTSHDKEKTNVGKTPIAKKKYWNYLDGLVSLGALINGSYYWITDDYPGNTLDYYLAGEQYMEDDVYMANEIYYKCYIGIKEESVNKIEGTVTVGNGQIKNLSGTSLIMQDAVLEVQEGGTVFISGNCFNNGIIRSSGGTIVVQKGAVITTADSTSGSGGKIIISGGDLIVREGARVVNSTQYTGNDKAGGTAILVEEDGYVINKGIISVMENIKVSGKAEIDNEGCIYTGYDRKDKSQSLLGYTPEDTDMSVSEFVDYAEALFTGNVKNVKNRSIMLIEKDGSTGVLRNEGKSY